MTTLSPTELLDYRRTVSDNYTRLRQSTLSLEERSRHFRQARDELFASHPQSALSRQQQANFSGLHYYPYDPAWRFVLALDRDVQPDIIAVPLQDDGLFRMQRFARIHFTAQSQQCSLSLFWIMGYGGGIFLPFRDETNQAGDTYGGGRYLLDTIKHADLGTENGNLVIDFNYAYNPSCAYNPRWHCPLPPQENWLPISIPAGERVFPANQPA